MPCRCVLEKKKNLISMYGSSHERSCFPREELQEFQGASFASCQSEFRSFASSFHAEDDDEKEEEESILS